MLSEISDILGEFRKCFSRTASFNYFVLIVFGLIVRYDFHGVTSFIRCLGVWPDYYESVLALFRSNSFRLENINRCWIHIVKKYACFPTINGCWLFVGDGVKVPKEGRRMPGAKELHQESENSSKPNRFLGHHFGVIGIIAGNARKMLCIPLMAEVQEGVKELRPLQGKTPPVVDGKEKVTVVTLMALLGCKAALYLNHPSMLILDAGYVSGEIFKMAMQFCKSGKYLGIITRGKKTFVGFEERHVNNKKKSGFIFRRSIKLFDLFVTRAKDFTTVTLPMYGKDTTVSYLCVDLYWKEFGEKIRFVLVRFSNKDILLMCSNLTWLPVDIITAYSYRFKIEVSFKNLKHQIGSFCYRFWTSAMPKLKKHYVPSIVSLPTKSKARIVQAFTAMEIFVNLSCIALGLLQIMALAKPAAVWSQYSGWLRTVRSDIPSEETVRRTVQHSFFFEFESFRETLVGMS
ncbi:MAG: hypothetical protein M0Z41_01855, partial [Peptococcaceae bacterium]|nr:hypothetical protein [Peptococcaceae bacterium]